LAIIVGSISILGVNGETTERARLSRMRPYMPSSGNPRKCRPSRPAGKSGANSSGENRRNPGASPHASGSLDLYLMATGRPVTKNRMLLSSRPAITRWRRTGETAEMFDKVALVAKTGFIGNLCAAL